MSLANTTSVRLVLLLAAALVPTGCDGLVNDLDDQRWVVEADKPMSYQGFLSGEINSRTAIVVTEDAPEHWLDVGVDIEVEAIEPAADVGQTIVVRIESALDPDDAVVAEVSPGTDTVVYSGGYRSCDDVCYDPFRITVSRPDDRLGLVMVRWSVWAEAEGEPFAVAPLAEIRID